MAAQAKKTSIGSNHDKLKEKREVIIPINDAMITAPDANKDGVKTNEQNRIPKSGAEASIFSPQTKTETQLGSFRLFSSPLKRNLAHSLRLQKTFAVKNIRTMM